MEMTRITNDVNGNPRYVVHFLEIADNYALAINKAKGVGGKKYHNKQFGGGIVFQSYDTADLIKRIKELREQHAK